MLCGTCVCGTYTISVPDAVIATRISQKAVDARRRRRACAREGLVTIRVMAVRVGPAWEHFQGPGRAHLCGHQQDQQETVRARGTHLLLRCICAVQHHPCSDIRASNSSQAVQRPRTDSAVARGRSGSASLHCGCWKDVSLYISLCTGQLLYVTTLHR